MKAAVTCLALWFTAFLACASGEKVCLIKINGAIGPATASYISRSIGEAQSQNAQCLIIQLNTPGGLLDSTQVIVQKLLASPVPVVVYVAPIGATATSAGCFITLAATLAAMAPATTIGAAHPVTIGGGIPSGDGQKPDDTMKQKLENFAVSYIEAIAAKRNRNVEWAKSAVRESASIPVDKALELKVIEIIAKDLADLQQQLDGRVVEGKKLKTAGAEVIEIATSASEQIFQLLWRPEVMFVLMLVAIYGIIGELSTPGAILPGVVGAIALVLVLYMAAILPINVTGLILIGLAFALFAFDVFAPSHGVLTVGGIMAFLIGSLMLFDRDDPLFRLSLDEDLFPFRIKISKPPFGGTRGTGNGAREAHAESEQRGAVNHLVRGVSSICPHRFDAGFVPAAKPDRDAIIVTRNSPLISAVSRKRSGEYSSAAALSSAMAVAGGHC